MKFTEVQTHTNLGWLLHWFASTPITNYPKLGGLKQQKINFFIVLEARNPKAWCQQSYAFKALVFLSGILSHLFLPSSWCLLAELGIP